MKLTKVKFTQTFFSVLLLCAVNLLCVNAMAASVDAGDFIEHASAQNLAEIELGKLALQKSEFAEVKTFARKMIEDHSSANKDLRELASKKNLQLADETELLAKAKNAVLTQREGESFDTSYINNQIDAHKANIKLFQAASSSPDEDVRRLAATSLPKMQQHLRDAEALVGVIARANKNLDEKLEYK